MMRAQAPHYCAFEGAFYFMECMLTCAIPMTYNIISKARFIITAIFVGNTVTALLHACNMFMLLSPLAYVTFAVVATTRIEEEWNLLPTTVLGAAAAIRDAEQQSLLWKNLRLPLCRFASMLAISCACAVLIGHAIGGTGGRNSNNNDQTAVETDGAHIGGLLKAKFGLEEANFHGKLYLCIDAFRFITRDVMMSLTEGLALPASVAVLIAVIADLLREAPAFHGKAVAVLMDTHGVRNATSARPELVFLVVRSCAD